MLQHVARDLAAKVECDRGFIETARHAVMAEL